MQLQNRKIFIVEDDLENRMIMRIALGLAGAKVEFDMLGRSAVRGLKAFQPVDAILLDLMLSRFSDGYQVYDDIRRETAFAKTPIIAVSAADPSTALPLCRERGFDGFIAKPIDDQLFPEQIARVIAGEPVWDAGSRI